MQGMTANQGWLDMAQTRMLSEIFFLGQPVSLYPLVQAILIADRIDTIVITISMVGSDNIPVMIEHDRRVLE